MEWKVPLSVLWRFLLLLVTNLLIVLLCRWSLSAVSLIVAPHPKSHTNSLFSFMVKSFPLIINFLILRCIVQSLKKLANPCHKRLHVAHVTSTENLAIKLSKRRKPCSSNNEPCSSNANSKPWSSNANSKPFSSNTTKPIIASKFQCCVCGSEWRNALEDWMQCWKWACETCFSITLCANFE